MFISEEVFDPDNYNDKSIKRESKILFQYTNDGENKFNLELQKSQLIDQTDLLQLGPTTEAEFDGLAT